MAPAVNFTTTTITKARVGSGINTGQRAAWTRVATARACPATNDTSATSASSELCAEVTASGTASR